MRLRQYFDQEPKAQTAQRLRSKNTPGSVFQTIAAHKSFVPMVSVWGAAVLGLSFMVLPGGTIAQIAAPFGLDALGASAKYMFAGVAALLGGGLAFVIAKVLSARARRSKKPVSIVSNVAARRVRPINPAADLGSESLDAPIDKMPFASEEDRTEDGEFVELAGADAGAGADSDGAPQPTLGELAQRGYDIQAPHDDYAADQSDDKGSDQGGFTRSHFKTALIETCEGATCEAAETEESSAAPAQEAAPGQPLGRPTPAGASSGAMSGGAWSLTQFTPDTAPKPADAPADEPADEAASEKPRALDLGEFAALPGRNGVWVEEPASYETNSSEPNTSETAPSKRANPGPRAVPDAPVGALEKLRQTPTQELSLVQMVERFAGALHDHQQAERGRVPQNPAGRDVALAEALKALTLFTERGFDQPSVPAGPANETELGQTERELRDALAKLQNLRGAA